VLEDGSIIENADLAGALARSAVCAQFQILPVLRAPGELAVLFDNERGKGDHRHIGEVEGAYRFESPNS